ncbi:hypothetical protein Tco_0043584, partial [Tanacetum coccineum]
MYRNDIENDKLEEVNGHLEIMRPLITNFGGRAKVLSVQEGEYIVKYIGPESSGWESKQHPKRSFGSSYNKCMFDAYNDGIIIF